jgi:hypothetical protein
MYFVRIVFPSAVWSSHRSSMSFAAQKSYYLFAIEDKKVIIIILLLFYYYYYCHTIIPNTRLKGVNSPNFFLK